MKTLKIYITFLVCFAFCMYANAQDILVKKDGSTLQIKTEEISETTIKYHLWNNLTGPLRSISIENVISINYANGEIERFNTNETPVSPEQPTKDVKQPATPSQMKDDLAKSTSVTIARGLIIPIYWDFTIKNFGGLKHKEACLAYVKEDVIIDGCVVIPKGSEVYGTGKGNKGFSWVPKIELNLNLLYIITPNGTLIPVDGILHIKLPIVSPNNVRTKEATSFCTVKEDVTISLAD